MNMYCTPTHILSLLPKAGLCTAKGTLIDDSEGLDELHRHRHCSRGVFMIKNQRAQVSGAKQLKSKLEEAGRQLVPLLEGNLVDKVMKCLPCSAAHCDYGGSSSIQVLGHLKMQRLCLRLYALKMITLGALHMTSAYIMAPFCISQFAYQCAVLGRCPAKPSKCTAAHTQVGVCWREPCRQDRPPAQGHDR